MIPIWRRRDLSVTWENGAGVHVVEAADQVDDGGLAGACRAYNGVGVTGICGEAYFVENLYAIFVAKADILKGDRAVDGRHFHSVRGVFYLHRLINCLKNAL